MNIKNVEELHQIAKDYEKSNKEMNRIKKVIAPVKGAIKKFMLDTFGEKSSQEFEDGLSIKLGQQNRSSVNTVKLLALLKSKGFKSAIKIVERPDEAEVERLIYDGELSMEDYSKCIDEKVITTLRIKGGK